MNVAVSPVAAATPATWLALRNVAARLLDASPIVEPAVAAEAGIRTAGEDPPERPMPFTLRLHAAAAEAPVTRPASIAARMGDRYMAGAERPMTASGAGPLAETKGTDCPARSSNADCSPLDNRGVAAERRGSQQPTLGIGCRPAARADRDVLIAGQERRS